MKLSLIAARSRNGIIGCGPDIPWHAQGEQLLFKAMTFNQWLLMGRKTFQSMGVLADRRYAVVSRSGLVTNDPGVLVFPSIERALQELPSRTGHLFVAGGGEVYHRLINEVDWLHISTVDIQAAGDIAFPAIPDHFQVVFEQQFYSNLDYTYQIWQRRQAPATGRRLSGAR